MESSSFNTLFKTGIIGFTSECYAIIFDLRWMILGLGYLQVGQRRLK